MCFSKWHCKLTSINLSSFPNSPITLAHGLGRAPLRKASSSVQIEWWVTHYSLAASTSNQFRQTLMSRSRLLQNYKLYLNAMGVLKFVLSIPLSCLADIQLQVSDPEALINVLKASLRTSNLHLTNATLSALPTILPVLISRPVNTLLSSGTPHPSSSTSSASPSNLIDASTLRLALTSFLQPGGVIDRLGDKERAQTKARDTLVILGGYAFRYGGGSAVSSKSGKAVETPIAVFERFLKEGGLASKVWKVREQVYSTFYIPDYRLNYCSSQF